MKKLAHQEAVQKSLADAKANKIKTQKKLKKAMKIKKINQDRQMALGNVDAPGFSEDQSQKTIIEWL